ncbi:hypothetical protein GAGA_0098 [Paraglaciecola agarilytica NO2]|uniref:Uncharacterized protein n=1 Tax=Paraglaciecola agarilytica NO2 TaxID=1125747 RepID=A0ABQ0I0X0_9ALTE|nr:hypothetical protein GAGA_0098 [Paraglaciecola agarilytica NO2]
MFDRHVFLIEIKNSESVRTAKLKVESLKRLLIRPSLFDFS